MNIGNTKVFFHLFMSTSNYLWVPKQPKAHVYRPPLPSSPSDGAHEVGTAATILVEANNRWPYHWGRNCRRLLRSWSRWQEGNIFETVGGIKSRTAIMRSKKIFWYPGLWGVQNACKITGNFAIASAVLKRGPFGNVTKKTQFFRPKTAIFGHFRPKDLTRVCFMISYPL